MINDKDFNLIHDFLFGKLTTTEAQKFRTRLEQDKLLQTAYNEEKMMKDIADKLQQKRIVNKTLQAINKIKQQKNAAKKNTYTLNELLNFFKPIDQYESYMYNDEALVVKSAQGQSNKLNIEVTSPLNNADINGNNLQFTLKGTVDFEISLVIKNSKDEDVATLIIPPDTSEIILNLPSENLTTPGRYYWRMKPVNQKIARQYNALIKVFFIRKNLMPPEYR